MVDKKKILENKDELFKLLDEIKETLERLDNVLAGEEETEDSDEGE